MSNPDRINVVKRADATGATKLREVEILRSILSISGDDFKESMRKSIREIIAWSQNRRGNNLPKIAWDGKDFDYLEGGRNCAGIRLLNEENDIDIWAFRSDEPDKTVAGRSWITEVIIARLQVESLQISVRLLANTSEGKLPIVAAMPGFIRQISNVVGLTSGGTKLGEAPFFIENSEGAEDLLDFILSHRRKIPAIVIVSDGFPGSVRNILFDIQSFAAAMLGLAHVFVLPSQFTWVLSDRLGRRLSVFDGGIRIYKVGFSDDDSPYGNHDLFVRKDIATRESADAAAEWIRNTVADESVRRIKLDNIETKFSSIKSFSLDLLQNQLSKEGASDKDQLDAASGQIATLKKNLNEAKEWSVVVEEENSEITKVYQSYKSQLAASKLRIDQLQQQFKAAGRVPDADLIIPNDWNDFADWCDNNLAGRILITSSARRGVKSPLFNDPGLVARALLWLANDYRNARIDGGADNLRDHPLEEGVRNSPCGGDSYKIFWQEKQRNVEWHIKMEATQEIPRDV